MATPILKVYERDAVGKNSIVKVRREGKLPAILYSRGQETQNLYLDEKEFQKLLNHYGTSIRIGLDLAGEKSFAIIKEVQRMPVKNTLLHVDLQKLNENEKIKISLPIHIINKDEVETSSEIVQVQLTDVDIQTLPKYLPDRVEVDAKILKEKDNITLADISIANNKNIEILTDKNAVIATMAYASKVIEAEEQQEDIL
ncbi:50S ribosomal protein L25 [Alkaliphilus peptidifermentans]|uniref:Large ribosomal subunit protein bL25 n=1 Tax=Alkaliphilus peptidifermentans DSM 18978 TaxID=1120976 RepID=A0A1G5AT44_9FIRM|nr:50S ribosomal protein L25 [Alkaliphilus peptidifermentans]SCX81058.1 LSU ribosomal protein L25P [Alkaliphilus peptidifermentans DSM 18978]